MHWAVGGVMQLHLAVGGVGRWSVLLQCHLGHDVTKDALCALLHRPYRTLTEGHAQLHFCCQWLRRSSPLLQSPPFPSPSFPSPSFPSPPLPSPPRPSPSFPSPPLPFPPLSSPAPFSSTSPVTQICNQEMPADVAACEHCRGMMTSYCHYQIMLTKNVPFLSLLHLSFPHLPPSLPLTYLFPRLFSIPFSLPCLQPSLLPYLASFPPYILPSPPSLPTSFPHLLPSLHPSLTSSCLPPSLLSPSVMTLACSPGPVLHCWQSMCSHKDIPYLERGCWRYAHM